MFLIVPDNDPDQEFNAEDLDDAHRICRERGFAKFDVWSVPHKHEVMMYAVTGPHGERVGLIGDQGLARDGLPPGFTVKEAVIDDGSTMIESNITTRQEV